MSARRASKSLALFAVVALCVGSAFVLAGTAFGGTGPGASGNTITNALQAQAPFSPGTLDSGQPVDVVVPTNSVLTPGATIFVLECAAPNGVDPTTINSCDGNTAYAGGTITVNGDGSIDVINSSTNSGFPYIVYALPDQIKLGEGSSNLPKCGLGSANECVLYIGQGGGSDTGLSQPHFFSQPFQVHPDPTDSGTLNPGDGTFPADSAPAITSANHTTFTQGSAGTFSVTATGYGPPTFTETGTLPTGVTLKTTFSGNSSTGVLAGTPTQSGSFPITFTATNGVGSPASQSFTLTVTSSGTAPVITSANHATFTQGTAGTFTVTATGSPTPTLAESGTLPAGLTFTASTGVLAGTPSVSGSFPVTFTATNGVGSPATQSFLLIVDTKSGGVPTITADGTVNCTTVAGKDGFSPALFATGNANSETSSVSVKLSGCTTTSNNLPVGSVITGKASWSTVTTSNGTANACSRLGTSKAMVETIKWTDKNSSGVTLAKLNPTTLNVSGFNSVSNAGGSPGFDQPQDSGGTASGTGSFVGTNAGATSESNLFTLDTQTQINALCGSSTGVTKLKLGGAGTTTDPSHFAVG